MIRIYNSTVKFLKFTFNKKYKKKKKFRFFSLPLLQQQEVDNPNLHDTDYATD